MGVLFKHVARMVDVILKVILISVLSLTFSDCQKHSKPNREYEEKVEYRNYKLVRMYTSGLNGDQNDLYNFLIPRVDFWTSPYENGTVDFMTSPQEYTGVVRHLQHKRIPFKIIMKDVQQAINAQMNDVAPDLKSDKLSNVPQGHTSMGILIGMEGIQ